MAGANAPFAVPSTRELELELVLTQRDAHIAELTEDLSALRLHVRATSGDTSLIDDSAPVVLPEQVVSVLVNHLSHAQDPSAGSSSSVTAALTQRVQLLQEENDELYSLLRRSETGKLRDQVASMTQMVERLEAALQDSHKIIKSLTTELDKTCTALQSQQTSSSQNTSGSPSAPRTMLAATGGKPFAPAQHNGSSKPPPTGPRAQKRQRMASPINNAAPRLSSANSTLPRERDRAPPPAAPDRAREPERERERDDRERDRDRFQDRERERDRSRSRSPARKARRGGSPPSRRSPPRGPAASRGPSVGSPASREPDLWPPSEHDPAPGGSRRNDRERDRPKRSGGGGRRRSGKPRDRGLAERLGL